jgi:hypothetical protein
MFRKLTVVTCALILPIVLKSETPEMQRNVYGEPLKLCSLSPITGVDLTKLECS